MRNPLRGLGIGQQIKRLKELTNPLTGEGSVMLEPPSQTTTKEVLMKTAVAVAILAVFTFVLPPTLVNHATPKYRCMDTCAPRNV